MHDRSTTLTGKYLFTALLLGALLPTISQAHEMQGIEHVHLSEGVVQIVEPIPGVSSSTTVKPNSAETKPAASRPTQVSGFASLIIQGVLIGSALVLVFFVIRASSISRNNPR